MDLHLAAIEHIRAQIIDLLIQFGPKLLTAILIIIAGVVVGGWVERWLLRALRRFELEPPLNQLISRVIRGLVLLLFVVMALQNLGVQLLPLIAGLGVAGAGVALAMQGVLSNIVAGLSIILTKPFRVGQYIQVAGVEGQVERISVTDYGAAGNEITRATLEALRANHITVPVPQREVRLLTIPT